jgi:hypothetical protein
VRGVPIWGGGRQSKEGGVLTKGGGAAIDRDRPRRDRKHEPRHPGPPGRSRSAPLDRLRRPVPGEFVHIGTIRRDLPSSNLNSPRFTAKPFVVAITGDLEQLLNTSAPDRGDDAELGKVSSDRIDDGRLLPNEQMACAMGWPPRRQNRSSAA